MDIAISIMAECTCVVESLIPGWNLQANVGVDTWRERGVNNQNVWRHHLRTIIQYVVTCITVPDSYDRFIDTFQTYVGQMSKCLRFVMAAALQSFQEAGWSPWPHSYRVEGRSFYC